MGHQDVFLKFISRFLSHSQNFFQLILGFLKKFDNMIDFLAVLYVIGFIVFTVGPAVVIWLTWDSE